MKNKLRSKNIDTPITHSELAIGALRYADIVNIHGVRV
jgi:hypothetical protein